MSTITIEANLSEELRLNFTKSGKAVTNLVVLENRRVKDAQGEWRNATPTRFDVVVWGPMAENAAESLTRGARVVTGSLFTEPDGERSTRPIWLPSSAPAPRSRRASSSNDPTSRAKNQEVISKSHDTPTHRS